MTKYILKRCKGCLWITIVVILLGAISTILANYIYKFIGFVIDYGLNFTGEEYSGEMSFLFSGKFGDYGTLKLIASLSIAMVISGLISYVATLVSCYIQKRGQNYIANKYRVEFFKKSIGKKPLLSNGDMMVLLNEDIYEVSNIFISYYSTIISSILSIIYRLLLIQIFFLQNTNSHLFFRLLYLYRCLQKEAMCRLCLD
jgi:ABC-type multidrug transport system fused ATPase/permease subunit